MLCRFIAALTLFLSTLLFASIQGIYEQPTRVVAIGDIHGDPVALMTILEDRGLIDKAGKWIGGKAHLVLMGDLLHRGPDSVTVIRMIMRLQREAQVKGGHVHALMGNHDLMAIGENAWLVESLDGMAAGGADHYATREEREGYDSYRLSTEMGLKESKGGKKKSSWIGYTAAFSSPDSDIAQWMQTRPAIIKIGRRIFTHADLDKWALKASIDDINTALRKTVISRQYKGTEVPKSDPHYKLVKDMDSILSRRNIFEGKVDVKVLDKVLDHFDADQAAFGHSVTESHAIEERHEGRAVFIDTGNSAPYRPKGGKLSALEISGGKAKVVVTAYNDIAGTNPFSQIIQCQRVRDNL